MSTHTNNCPIATFFAEHTALIERTVRRTLHAAGIYSESICEEVTADVCCHIYEKAITAYDGSGTVKGWIAMIAKRETIKRASKHEMSRRDSLSSFASDDSKESGQKEAGDQLPIASAHSPLKLVLRKEQTERLLDALATLERFERAVMRGLLAGWSGKKVATVTGATPVKVTRAKARALDKMRAELA